jgi:metal-responsive CopG/Arc/MetJ family transcriptional regulator
LEKKEVINAYISKKLLNLIDDFVAKKRYKTRSNFLLKALVAQLREDILRDHLDTIIERCLKKPETREVKKKK